MPVNGKPSLAQRLEKEGNRNVVKGSKIHQRAPLKLTSNMLYVVY